MKTVILYASRYGTARQCAQDLAKLLEGEVEVFDIEHESRKVNLSEYDQVICGGSVYIGSVNAALRQYCIHRAEELSSKRLGFFICGLSQGEQAEKDLQNAYPDRLLSQAAATGIFGTVMRPGRLHVFDKLIIKMVRKQMELDRYLTEEGNYSTLDQEEIRRFAAKMNGETLPEPAAPEAEQPEKE